MAGPSARLINPWRLADAGTSVRGDIPVSSMARLTSLLQNDSGSATYELLFARDEQSQPVITGRVVAEVQVICQRCLEPMSLKLASEVAIGVVDSAEAASAWETDAVVVEDDQLSVAGLVEDELILVLAPAPVHAAGECRPPGYAGAAGPDGAESGDGPFAALAELKSPGGPRRR